RLGPYGPLGDCERVLQKAEAQQGRDRDRQDVGPRPRADDRRWLAGGRRKGARVRQAVHMSRISGAALFVEGSVHQQVDGRHSLVARHETLAEVTQEVVVTRLRPLLDEAAARLAESVLQ